MKTIISIAIGFIMGIFSNAIFNRINDMSPIIYWILILLLGVLIYGHLQIEYRDKIITRFIRHLELNRGITFDAKFKYMHVTNCPKYIETIKLYFTENEIKKLNKWKRITNSDYSLIKNLV